MKRSLRVLSSRSFRFILISTLLLLSLLALSLPEARAAEENTSRVEATGAIEVLVFDYEERSDTTYSMILPNGKSVQVRFPQGPPKGLLTGAAVKIKGQIIGNNLLAANEEGSVQVVQSAEPATVGTRNAVVLILEFTDSSVSCSKTQIENLMWNSTPSVDGLYQESSFGKLSFPADTDGDGQADVFGPLLVNHSITGSCDYSAWASAADQAAQDAGVNLSLYQHRIYVLPNNVPCSWAGLGNLGCSTTCRAWVKGNYCHLQDVYSHELGHNISMHHAATDPENDGNTNSEYGDRSCDMGYAGGGWRHFNAPHKAQMGWPQANQVVDVTQGGTYDIGALELNSAEAKMLKISKPDTNEFYYLSYRAPEGNHSANLGSAYRYRTSVHRYRGSGASFTHLIKALADGEVFQDAANGITVRQVSNTGTSAQVQISFECAPQDPTISLSPSSRAVGGAAQAAEYTLMVTNNDNSCDSSTIFDLSAALPAELAASFSSSSIELAPGQAGSVSLEISSVAGTFDGSYSFSVTASDNDGFEPVHSAASDSGSYIIDSSAPDAVSDLTATVQKKSRVALNWSAPSDNGGSGVASYEIYRDGAMIVSSTATSYTDNGASAGATYTYYVVAIDALGHSSNVSNSVEVTVANQKGGGNSGEKGGGNGGGKGGGKKK